MSILWHSVQLCTAVSWRALFKRTHTWTPVLPQLQQEKGPYVYHLCGRNGTNALAALCRVTAGYNWVQPLAYCCETHAANLCLNTRVMVKCHLMTGKVANFYRYYACTQGELLVLRAPALYGRPWETRAETRRL